MTVKFDSMQEMFETLQPNKTTQKCESKKEQQQFDVKRFVISWLIWIATMLIAAPIVTISYRMIVHALR